MPRRCGTPGRKLCTSTSAVRTSAISNAWSAGCLRSSTMPILLRFTPTKARLSAARVEGYLRRLSALGALTGQQGAAIGPGDVGAQVEHPQTTERALGAAAQGQCAGVRVLGGKGHGILRRAEKVAGHLCGWAPINPPQCPVAWPVSSSARH